mmetsp:Transcript_42298/g.100343  ORF Transcript_42298/g.100343 Transcript_42298/m.100343 type:complete len:150 (-) Transcript_42298:48-497(-)|eukprot:CAMPEP_0177596806 /NCGR_PEP_ID=MMETSP0419_2-20121207/11339_1 /TAXON_ID=582737 /ORGANISM="Tetraselmis sp., Strain GSL018" /LENGTH=149 /DNA_ID=CAMNT_0019088863 /DNA_START=202 /DNA_END=651 /DNA_ORIENTATION=+
MASFAACPVLKPVVAGRASVQRSSKTTRSVNIVASAAPSERKQVSVRNAVLSASAGAVSLASAQGAYAVQEVVGDLAAEVNVLGVVACALFILLPTSFLLTLYIKSSSEGNVSGGFSQAYYDKSKAEGKKKTNLSAALKGKGLGMYPDK